MDKVASFFFKKSILLIPKKPFFWVLYHHESYGGFHFSTILYNFLRIFFFPLLCMLKLDMCFASTVIFLLLNLSVTSKASLFILFFCF